MEVLNASQNGLPTSNIFKSGSLTIEPTETKCKCNTFKAVITDENITIEVLTLGATVFIWIGAPKNPSLNDISLSIQNRTHPNEVLRTKIFGVSEESLQLSQRLCKKLNKQVFVSLNIMSDVGFTSVPNVEKVLKKIIKDHPESF